MRAVGRANRTHGHAVAETRTYRTWQHMLGRCKTHPAYVARGIVVCDRWQSFEAFLADMGERPPGRSLDRVDNAGNYEPGNCRWATPREQQANMRTNVFLEYDGARLIVSEWARRVGIDRGTIVARLARGWTVADALTRRP